MFARHTKGQAQVFTWFKARCDLELISFGVNSSGAATCDLCIVPCVRCLELRVNWFTSLSFSLASRPKAIKDKAPSKHV